MKNIIRNVNLDYRNDVNLSEKQLSMNLSSAVPNKYVEKSNLESKLKERIEYLEAELSYTKECLQVSFEEGKAATEELKISNKELSASNEELLATNEEFEAVNAELQRINTQYQQKLQELAEWDNDIKNYLYNTNIGTIFLDANLCIRRFTPSITKEINLKANDIGRPLQHISNNLIADELNNIVTVVMSNLMPFEKEVKTKNGKWYLLKCAPYRTPENSCKGAIISLIDITRRKRAEIEQAKSKERYEQLVEYSPYAIYIIQNGKFHFSNSAGVKLLNVKGENELMFRPFRHYFNIDEQELIDNGRSSDQILEKAIICKEDRIIRSDGNELLVEISAIPLLFDGKEAKLLFVKDISFRIEEKQLREENERSKKLLSETILSETLKTEFFSNLSHELRTPLNVILSTLQLLDVYTSGSDVPNITERFKKYFNIMKQNCYRQLRLVNNMIDITKLDAGFFELNLQNCNIVNVVENVTMSVSEYIKNQSIELVFDTDIEECIIACDPYKIERIILNLLSNSIKFTKQGGSMTVNMYSNEDNIAISIKDTGIGIPPDKLDIIFDRFRQVDKSLTRKQEGSGIGLSIVKSLVELHGGSIFVMSEYGKGTEFIINLPIIAMPEETNLYRVIKDEPQDRIERIHIEFSDIYSLT